MATLTREWVSVAQAQQWLDTYDPTGASPQLVDALASEMRVGRNLRWHHAIILDATTHVCHKGLKKLRAIVRGMFGIDVVGEFLSVRFWGNMRIMCRQKL